MCLPLPIIGEQFTFYNYVTGCVLQRRQKEDRIQLWTRGNPDKAQDEQIQQLIGIEFKHVLNLCPTTELTYTKHNQVMVLDDIKKSKGTFDGYYMRDDNKLSSKGKRSRSRNRRRSRSRSKSGQNSRRNSSQQLLPALATPAEASEQIIVSVIAGVSLATLKRDFNFIKYLNNFKPIFEKCHRKMNQNFQ